MNSSWKRPSLKPLARLACNSPPTHIHTHPHSCTPLLHPRRPQVFGGKVVRAPSGVMHGKSSPVFHTNTGLLEGLENPFK